MRFVLLLVVLAMQSFSALGFGTNAAQRVVGIAPFAATEVFAKQNKIPLGKIDGLLAGEGVKRGDSVTVLITITEKGGAREQWLLFTEIAGEPAASNGVMVIHNTFGNTFRFPSHPTPVSLRTAGPFLEKGSARLSDATSSFKLDAGYLSLGLDQAAAAVSRLDVSKKRKGSFQSGTTKFSEAVIAESMEFAAEWKLTTAEERALGGTYPALLSYFEVVQHTDTLESILAEVIDRPSLLSLAMNLGISNIQFNWQGARQSELPASAWGMSDEIPVYEIPMILRLNQHPSLNITMMVTAPRPPLLTSAGIIGVLGEKPGKSEPYMTIRIINGRLGPRGAAR